MINQGWVGAIDWVVQGKFETRGRSLTAEYQGWKQKIRDWVGGRER